MEYEYGLIWVYFRYTHNATRHAGARHSAAVVPHIPMNYAIRPRKLEYVKHVRTANLQWLINL